jgi:hypothetical protein
MKINFDALNRARQERLLGVMDVCDLTGIPSGYLYKIFKTNGVGVIPDKQLPVFRKLVVAFGYEPDNNPFVVRDK